MLVLQLRHDRRGKRINFEHISFYTQYLGYASVDNAAHTISNFLDVFSGALLLLIAKLNVLSTKDNAAYCRVYFSKNQKTSNCGFLPKEKRNASTSFRVANFKQLPARSLPVSFRSGQKGY